MKYYALEQKEKKASLYIFGSISSYPLREKDKDAYGIVKELSELDAEEIEVHINSTGGSVAEGLAIYNVLKNSEMKITTYVDGFACSAASVIFMAGDERVMNEASLLMIHNAWSRGQGDANAFRRQADNLDIITQASIKAYMRHVSITEDELKDMMDSETWLSADDAKEKGFATKVLEENTEEANQSAMKSIRDKLLNGAIAPVQLYTQKYPTSEEIAQAVVEKMNITQKPECPKNSWDTFFN